MLNELERKLADRVCKIISLDLKSEILLKVEELDRVEYKIGTGVRSDTDIHFYIQEIKKTLNQYYKWNLPTADDLEESLKMEVESLALKFSSNEFDEKKKEAQDRNDKLPCIEKIELHLIKEANMKLAGQTRFMYEIRLQSNDPVSFIPTAYTLSIPQYSLEENFHIEEPEEYEILRGLVRELFTEAKVHLQIFLQNMQKAKNEIREEIEQEEAQLNLR